MNLNLKQSVSDSESARDAKVSKGEVGEGFSPENFQGILGPRVSPREPG